MRPFQHAQPAAAFELDATIDIEQLVEPEQTRYLERLLDLLRARDWLQRRKAALSQKQNDDILAAFGTAEALRAALDHIVLIPVLTAHPSELRPLSVIQVLASLPEEASEEEAFRALQGVPEKVFSERPLVSDETARFLDTCTRVLFEALPEHLARMQAAVDRVYGHAAPRVPSVFRFHSWVGSDRDGNPSITADVLLATARAARACAIGYYRSALERLCCGEHETLMLQDPQTAAFLLHVRDLAAALPDMTSDDVEEAFAHLHHEALRLSAPSYATTIARLQQTFATFGIHIASNEWRQHSDEIIGTFDELRVRCDPEGLRLCEMPADRAYAEALSFIQHTKSAHNGEPLSVRGKELISSLRALADMRHDYGASAVGALIVSHCTDAVSILVLDYLARETGTFARGELPIVPLFESITALRRAPIIVEQLLSTPHFRAKIRALDNRLEIMLGYSDAAKDGGRLAADIELRRAEAAICSVCEQYDVIPRIFHGRGGSPARGLATYAEGFAMTDRRLPPGEMKVTEQGELVANRYGDAVLAGATLNAWFLAALAHLQAPKLTPREEFQQLEIRLAQAGCEAFLLLRERQRFFDHLRRATPLDAVRRLPLASRPASRQDDHGFSRPTFASLRAIPLNIACTAARLPLTAWYGTGTALAAEIQAGRLALVREAYATLPALRYSLQTAASALRCTDLLQLERRLQTHSGDRGADEFVDALLSEAALLADALDQCGVSPPAGEGISEEHLAVLAQLSRFEQKIAAGEQGGAPVDEHRMSLVVAAFTAACGVSG